MKNFPTEDYTDDDLRLRFETYGEIISAVIMRDENEKSKGFGFVCFKDWQDAQKANDELGVNSSRDSADSGQNSSEENVDTDGKPRRGLYVREAKTKEQRTLELQKSTY